MPTSRSTAATPSSPVSWACFNAAMVRRNSSNAFATSRFVAWNRRSSLFWALVNSEPMYFSNPWRASRPRARVPRLDTLAIEDGRPPRRFEIGDVLHGHDGALIDQSIQAGGMYSSRAFGTDPKSTRVFEPVE